MRDDTKEREEHELHVKAALKNMPSKAEIELMSYRFKALSEPSRLNILFTLEGGELCVEHITEAVGGNQSAVSHQLKTLKDNRIIKSRRSGKNVLYSISDHHVLVMLEMARGHLNCNE